MITNLEIVGKISLKVSIFNYYYFVLVIKDINNYDKPLTIMRPLLIRDVLIYLQLNILQGWAVSQR